MERYFNTEGLCEPDVHYMVRLDDRLEKQRQAVWKDNHTQGFGGVLEGQLSCGFYGLSDAKHI